MTISVVCSCGQPYDLPNELAGKQARCQVCRNVFNVPAANAQAAVQPTIAQPMAQTTSSAQLPVANQQTQQQPLPQAVPASFQDPVGLQNPVQPQANVGYQNPAAKQAAAGKSNKQLYIVLGGVGAVVMVSVIIGFWVFGGSESEAESKTKTAKNNTSSTERSTSPSRDDQANQPKGPIRNPSTEESKATSPATNQAANQPTKRPQSAPKKAFSLPKSKKGLFNQVTSYRIGSSAVPKLITSRNGQFAAINSVSDPNQLILIDMTKPKTMKVLHSLRGNTLHGISNDGNKLILEKDGVTSVRDRANDKHLMRTLQFPKQGTIEFASDPNHVLVHDLQSVRILAPKGTDPDEKMRFIWAHKCADRKMATYSWTNDLRYAYFVDNQAISRIDETTGAVEAITPNYITSDDFVPVCISRNARFAAYRSGDGFSIVNLLTQKELGFCRLNDVAKAEQFGISDNGGVAFFTNRRGSQNVISIINVSELKVVEQLTLDSEFHNILLSPSGQFLFTLSRADDTGFMNVIWQTSLGEQLDSSNAIKTFVEFVPESERYSAEYKSLGGAESKNSSTTSSGSTDPKSSVASNPSTNGLPEESGSASSPPSVPPKNDSRGTPQSSSGQPAPKPELTISAESLSNTVATVTQMLDQPGENAGSPRVSNDGKTVAFDLNEKVGFAIWNRNTNEIEKLPQFKKCDLVAISPDGNRIAGHYSDIEGSKFVDGLWVWDRQKKQMIYENQELKTFSSGIFSDDGSRFLFTSAAFSAVIDLTSKTAEPEELVTDKANCFDATGKRVFGMLLGDGFGAANIADYSVAVSMEVPNMTLRTPYSFSPDYKVLYGQGSVLNFADIRKKKVLSKLEFGIHDDVTGVILGKNSQIAIVKFWINNASKIKLVKIEKDKLVDLGGLNLPDGLKIKDLQISDDGSELTALVYSYKKVVGSNRKIVVWKISRGAKPDPTTTTQNSATDKSVGKADDAKRISKAKGLTLVATSPPILSPPVDIALSENGKIAIAVASNNLIARWNVDSNSLTMLNTKKTPLKLGAIRNDARLMYSPVDRSIWDLSNGKQIRKLKTSRSFAIYDDGYFSEDKTKVLLRSGEQAAVWDIKENKIVKTMQMDLKSKLPLIMRFAYRDGIDSVVAMEYSGKYHVVGKDGTAVTKTWNKEAKGVQTAINGISANGMFASRVVVDETQRPNVNKFFRIDIDTGTELLYHQSTQPVELLGLNHDGNLALVATGDGLPSEIASVISISDSSAKAIASLGRETRLMSLNPNSNFVIAYDRDKRMRIWKLAAK